MYKRAVLLGGDKALIISHVCYECGFSGDVIEISRKIECPKCKTVNDVWFDDEEVPERHKLKTI